MAATRLLRNPLGSFGSECQPPLRRGLLRVCTVEVMAASDHLQPRQFGPGGKYTTRLLDLYDRPVHPESDPKYVHSVEAVHTNSGRLIGRMNWHAQATGAPPTIHKVVVSKPMRRKGMATAMLNHARDIAPGLQHSGDHALTDDGRAWAEKRP